MDMLSDNRTLLHDVRAAETRLAGRVRATALVDSPALSELVGAQVFLKLENRQLTGSFKDRGAFNRLLGLDDESRGRGVIAMSAGNHAQAVAYVSKQLGVAATVVMPATTPFLKVRRTRAFGATVVLHGQSLADASEKARELQLREGLTLIHPYDDPAIIAGQGTIGLEIARAAPLPDIVLVPVGGGGLLAGISLAIKNLAPKIQVIGVQTRVYSPLAAELKGEPAGAIAASTIADGIAIKSIGALPLQIIRSLVDDVVTVSESDIESAIHYYLESEKLVVEGAGAVTLAFLLAHRERFADKRVALVVSGGNIDTGLLASVITRVRLREHRIHLIRVEISDQPGVLARVATIISSIGANILNVQHQRESPAVAGSSAHLDICFETQRPEDAEDIAQRLVATGFPTRFQE
jgi:threonine dehydratase